MSLLHYPPDVVPETASFLQKDAYQRHQSDCRDLLRPFNVPRLVCVDICSPGNGYFGSKEICNETSQVQSYSLYAHDYILACEFVTNAGLGCWLRCLVKIAHHCPHTGSGYTWHEMTFFCRWEPSYCMVFCVDTPDGFRVQLEESLDSEHEMLDLTDPFALLIPIVDQIGNLYDQSVWSIRDLIRQAEKVCVLAIVSTKQGQAA